MHADWRFVALLLATLDAQLKSSGIGYDSIEPSTCDSRNQHAADIVVRKGLRCLRSISEKSDKSFVNV